MNLMSDWKMAESNAQPWTMNRAVSVLALSSVSVIGAALAGSYYLVGWLLAGL
jgi:hypothetical protein